MKYRTVFWGEKEKIKGTIHSYTPTGILRNVKEAFFLRIFTHPQLGDELKLCIIVVLVSDDSKVS